LGFACHFVYLGLEQNMTDKQLLEQQNDSTNTVRNTSIDVGVFPRSSTDARQIALDKKAENARELGLGYEPAAQEEIQRLTALVRAQQITIDKLEAQRQLVGLSDEEILAASEAATYMDELDAWVFAKELEAKLKEKNT
jgi:hypothetical protein